MYLEDLVEASYVVSWIVKTEKRNFTFYWIVKTEKRSFTFISVKSDQKSQRKKSVSLVGGAGWTS